MGGHSSRPLARPRCRRAVATGRPVEGPPLTSDTRLVHSPADLLEGLADK